LTGNWLRVLQFERSAMNVEVVVDDVAAAAALLEYLASLRAE
jgi:hypothetical protein